MSIPTFDKLLRPLLVLSTREPLTRRSATDKMSQHFALTPEQCQQRIPSGASTLISNRTGWAMTFLTKAGLIEKTAPKTYCATSRAKQFLNENPNDISVADLKNLPGWEEAWEEGKARRRQNREQEAIGTPESNITNATPQEIISSEITALNSELRVRLLQSILEQTPAFFEQLVLDVLIAMGYGGTRQDAAQHMGRSGDEGIDGKISQDSLGLDQILVQAKRYRPDIKIDRQQIQAFLGSLTGQGVNKGVFITTSSFAASAQEFVSRGASIKVVLVDGEMLINLMLRHKIGVRVAEKYEIHEIDQNYFETD